MVVISEVSRRQFRSCKGVCIRRWNNPGQGWNREKNDVMLDSFLVLLGSLLPLVSLVSLASLVSPASLSSMWVAILSYSIPFHNYSVAIRRLFAAIGSYLAAAQE